MLRAECTLTLMKPVPLTAQQESSKVTFADFVTLIQTKYKQTILLQNFRPQNIFSSNVTCQIVGNGLDAIIHWHEK